MAEAEGGSLLRERAYAAVRQAVCDGDLVPGSELTESELASRFGLTKAPLRAALQRLSQQGWLVASARRGYQVRPITLQDTHDIFAMRKFLEPAAARLAAGRVDQKVLHGLEHNCLQAHFGDTRQSQAAFFLANKALHVGIAQASGNERLADSIASLHDECERILRFGMKHLDWSQDWGHGHAELVEALSRNDADAAERVALRQLETSEKVVLDALMKGVARMPLLVAW